MVANVNNNLASEIGTHPYTIRESPVVRTPLMHEDGQPLFGQRPVCTQRNRCRRIWSCQTCHSIRARRYRHRIWEQRLPRYPDTQCLAVTITPTQSLLSSADPEVMGELFRSVSQLYKLRSQHRRRAKPRGLALIEYAAFYPHLLRDDGSSYPHLHGILAVSPQFNYVDFLDAMNSQTVKVHPTEPDKAGEGWKNYMVHEFLDTNAQSKDLATVDTGMALHFWRRCLLRETRENRFQLPCQKQTDEDLRWGQIMSLADTLQASSLVSEVLTLSDDRRERLMTIAKLLKAASIYQNGECFTVPTRRLSHIIDESESQIRQDLSLLESIGLIRKVATSRGKPTEYKYEESHQ